MANGSDRTIVDPAVGDRVFIVQVHSYGDGWDYHTHKRTMVALRCSVLDEDGFISYMRVPYEAGGLRGVPVEFLAKRLKTTPANILL